MKVLTVKQPYASAIVFGCKDVESLNWSTDYRGPLLIHSGSGGQDIGEINDPRMPLLTHLNTEFNDDTGIFSRPKYYKLDSEGMLEALHAFTDAEKAEHNFMHHSPEGLWTSTIVGAVNLVGVEAHHDSQWAGENEFQWLFENPIWFSLAERQIRGKLRLWDFPIEKLNESARTELTAWR